MPPARCGSNVTADPSVSGRATRTVSRRLRRALEHRDRSCAVPGCGATRGLHAHHIRHWEDGGPTELSNLVLVCPYHHRAHHRGLITITGPADNLVVTDSDGRATQRRITRAPTHRAPTRCPALPGTDRRTRRLVVVRTLPTTTTTHHQLGEPQRRPRREGLHVAPAFDLDGGMVGGVDTDLGAAPDGWSGAADSRGSRSASAGRQGFPATSGSGSTDRHGSPAR